MKERIFLSTPHMGGYEMDYINDAFEKNWIAPLGENVNNFEKELADHVGAPYAAALSSGTSAIHLALKLAGIKEGDIVFCSSLTFAATSNPIMYEKAVPVFIDSEADTWNMDPKALEKAFEKYPGTKAVVIVELYGQPAKMEEIIEICKKNNAVLIEDAAEALGSRRNGKFCGTFGKYGIFSFNGNKIITTSGGGMLVSDEEDKISKARFWATQSRELERHYEHKELGYNYRMSNIVAGIGRGQLKVLDERVKQKKEIFRRYSEGFKDISYIEMQPELSGNDSNCWLSCFTLKKDSPVKPLDIIIALENENIESRPIWKPMHMQPYYSFADFISVNEKAVSEDIFAKGLCLPSDTKMTEEQQDRVISIIKGLF